MQSEESGGRLWVDVSTLLDCRGNPTGIVRVVSQLVRHWLTDLPAVCLCAFDRRTGVFRAVAPEELRRPAPAAPVAKAPPGPAGPPAEAAPLPPWRGELRELGYHLTQAGFNFGRLARGGVGTIARRCRRAWTRVRGRGPQAPFARGDAVVLAGAGWDRPESWRTLFSLQPVLDLRLVHLIHDLTPLRQPQWCHPGFVHAFTQWLPGVLRHSALLLTISEHSRRDLIAHGREHGVGLPPIEVVREGDEPGDDPAEEAPPGLAEGPFALFVSSIGVHKNQALLLHVWRRLLERHGRDRVPPLVLVGQPAWRAGEILRDLHADRRLRGKVVHLAKANDRQLRWLYRRCLFTLYPSHYEGWGLPVAESLVHGKPCICSNAASLPEVGGGFADYHDPLDAPGCVRLVEQALFEPGWLQARAGRIGRDYRVTTWKDCAAQVARLLGERLGVNDAPRRRDAA